MRAEDRAQAITAANGEPERIEIIGFDGAFHGRSYAAVNAAGNPSYLEGFGPRAAGLSPRCRSATWTALEAAMGPTTAAVIIEPVQGEGGARALARRRARPRCAPCATRRARC